MNPRTATLPVGQTYKVEGAFKYRGERAFVFDPKIAALKKHWRPIRRVVFGAVLVSCVAGLGGVAYMQQRGGTPAVPPTAPAQSAAKTERTAAPVTTAPVAAPATQAAATPAPTTVTAKPKTTTKTTAKTTATTFTSAVTTPATQAAAQPPASTVVTQPADTTPTSGSTDTSGTADSSVQPPVDLESNVTAGS